MFKYLITIQPLGFLYGSAGAFLSPENLVGRSGSKFPPDAATLSGLFFNANQHKSFTTRQELCDELYVAGPFWAKIEDPEYFYVPLPRHKLIGEDTSDEWTIRNYNWCLKSVADDLEMEEDDSTETEYHWLKIDYWEDEPEDIRQKRNDKTPSVATKCWEYVPMLHPSLQKQERHVLPEDGLFLENAVQMEDDTCLVYLSTYPLENGWYQFGGENHIVEIDCLELPEDSPILEYLKTPIKRTFALITPGVWGSNQLSYRYPHDKNFAFNHNKIKMLTDKAVSHRYRIGYGEKPPDSEESNQSRLSRGRYAVPAGTVYVLKEPLADELNTWWKFPSTWFPEKGLMKKFGCGLCLPINIEGVDN